MADDKRGWPAFRAAHVISGVGGGWACVAAGDVRLCAGLVQVPGKWDRDEL